MQFWNKQTLSFNLVYSSTCYPAGMGTSKIRLLFATLLQHYKYHYLRPDIPPPQVHEEQYVEGSVHVYWIVPL